MSELEAHAAEARVATGLSITLSPAGQQVYVVFEAVPLPATAFRLAATDMLFVAQLQYPLAALDMFWTDLDVVRPDGSVPANADSIEHYLGRAWRRFSWHRGTWNPNTNGLLDHLAFSEARLAVAA